MAMREERKLRMAIASDLSSLCTHLQCKDDVGENVDVGSICKFDLECSPESCHAKRHDTDVEDDTEDAVGGDVDVKVSVARPRAEPRCGDSGEVRQAATAR